MTITLELPDNNPGLHPALSLLKIELLHAEELMNKEDAPARIVRGVRENLERWIFNLEGAPSHD